MDKLKLNISVLKKISHLVARRVSVAKMISETLDILHSEMGFLRGTITLREGKNLMIKASEGLSKSQSERGMYKIGEGITGKVALEGVARVIPDLSKEKEFLNKTGARGAEQNIAFICVPVVYMDDVIGTISIDCINDEKTDLDASLHLLEVIANIMAEAIYAASIQVEEREKLISENRRLQLELDNKFRPDEIIGNCSNMKNVYSMIFKVATSNATVLIRGESGTGKELVARAIQKNSLRKEKPFVSINCAALPEGLIESELFGHEKGSFTGAISQKIGLVEVANGGTLFLDEIGDLSILMQMKLLRFIQEHTFYRIGSNKERKVDVRIIAATSRNLEEKMRAGTFREDLYYRLNVFPIYLPALRNRKSDITALAEHFLQKYNTVHGKEIVRISTAAINMLSSYYWPGNVRELENCIEYALLNTSDNVISSYNLPPSLQTEETVKSTASPEFDESEITDYETLVGNFEREIIINALKNNNGNAAATAKYLKTTPRIILYKMKKLNIEPSLYK
ncbi:MAG: GAF domain-containing protein [Verrucomicrobiaceae bacterium]|nr:GAF domain-containing protein [Verrucomicrobiaceae bacterium]